MKNGNIDLKTLPTLLLPVLLKLIKYSVVLFLLLLALVYGFLIYKIDVLSNAQPSSADTTAAIGSSTIPRIDPTVVKSLQDLKDNSVNVQTIFNENRDNPFHE